jgi:drug/metabolite transporter (DMT)-like permease
MSAAHRRHAFVAVLIALASALFFTSTYVLNRAMASAGGHWAWSASLRYLLTMPMLALVLAAQRGHAPVWRALRTHPVAWLAWSSVGFGLFCVCLTWAAAYAPAWLVAGTFQLTVIAGMLLGPLLYRGQRARLPRAALALGAVIVVGVALMQGAHFGGHLDRDAWVALAAVAASAVLYPLGNRAILLHLERSGEPLDATQRVFGMTLASQPFFWLVAASAWHAAGPPPMTQVLLAGGVALFTGTIATILFFRATGMVRNDPAALGAVEAMQAAELLFSSALGVVLLGESAPHGVAVGGALLVVGGILGLGWLVGHGSTADAADADAVATDRGA